MKPTAKKLVSLMMSLLLVVSAVGAAAIPSFAEEAETVHSGDCVYNKDIKWTLDENGVLKVTGSGSIPSLWSFGKIGLAVSGDTNILSFLSELFDNLQNYGSYESYVKDVKTIVIGEGITSVGDGNFASCENAEIVQLPSTLKTIGKSSFAYTALSSVSIPASVTKIGEGAFYSAQLENVVFASNSALKEVGKLAFAKNPFTTLEIPACVESFAGNACSGNTAFVSYKVASGSKNYSASSDGVLFNADKTALVAYPDGITAANYTIPSSVKTVKSGAFTNKNLLSVTIPSSVTSMEADAFNCPSLREVYNLSSVKLTAGSDANGGAAKYAAVIHKSAYDASGFYSVGEYKFVTDGKTHTLYEYTGTDTNISLPADFSYDGFPVLTYEIGSNVFAKTDVVSAVIPAEVSAVGAGAFAECSSLKSVTFVSGSRLKKVDTGAFKNCTLIAVISLPEGTETVGKEAFSGCSSMIAFTLPTTVKEIGESAFADCVKLNTFVVPNDSALETVGKSAFSGDKALRALDFPETLVAIGEKAFENCSRLEAAKIPVNVKTIGKSAFSGCSALKSVTLAYDGRLGEIAERTFKDCSSLEEIIIPTGVQKIGEGAFDGCISLKAVYICSKDCDVDRDKSTIPSGTVIYGYPSSSAKNYSLLRLRDFESIKGMHLWSEATCTKPSVCYVCGEVNGEPNDHSFTQWEILGEADCTESGVKTRVCTVCGETQTEIIPALGHNYGEWYYVTDSVIGIEYKERICSVCGHKHAQSVAVIDETEPPKEPAVNYILGDVSGDGKITAHDARLALRACAQIDSITYVQSLAADVNLDGKVTAQDARKILRVASQLDKF